jgi:hypothetical protein
MRNTLSIDILPDGRVKTIFVTTDGVKHMEIHRAGLTDAAVLHRLANKKFYQKFPGHWFFTFEKTNRVISEDTFDEAISKSQEYIFNRDNNWYC